jgi:hypothetical protein
MHHKGLKLEIEKWYLLCTHQLIYGQDPWEWNVSEKTNAKYLGKHSVYVLQRQQLMIDKKL